MSTPARFSDGQYKNWLKCSQSLIIMKEALHDYINNEVKKLHGDIIFKLSSLPCGSATGNQCGSCLWKGIKLTGGNPRSWSINCKNSICDKWLHEILAVHCDPHNPTINWKNADISKWPTDCYHVAKIFMPKGQDKTTKMPEDLDAPAILSLMKYCNWFRKDLPNTQILSDLIDIRNKVLHSGDLRVADSDKDSWIDLTTQLLSDLKIHGDAQAELQKLKREDIDINFRETEIRVFQRMVNDLKNELTTLKEDMVSLQDSHSELSMEMTRLRDDTETTTKVDTVEADVKEMRKSLHELGNISDKMESFFDKNPDILDIKVTEIIKNVSSDIQDQQRKLLRVETELAARLSALEMTVEKIQEETKKQLEGVERTLASKERKENDEQLSLQNSESRKKRRQETDGLKQLKNQTEDKLDTLRRLEFIQTEQAEKAKKLLQKNRSIVIKGHPGEGKTTMALFLIDQEIYRYRRVVLNCPRDWKTVDTDCVDIVILDDIFGQFDLDYGRLQEWMLYLPTIQEHVDAEKLWVIITTRDDILSKSYSKLGSLRLFFNDFTLMLSSKVLTNSEKINILNRQLHKHNIYMNEDKKNCIVNISELIGFPQCCSIFAGDSKSFDKGPEFFRYPDKFFVSNITELDETGFLCMAFLFCNGKIWEENLSPETMNEPGKNLLMELASYLNISEKKASISELRDAYDRFLDLYVVKSMSSFSLWPSVEKTCIQFAHSTVCEAVGRVLADRCVEMVVKYGSAEYLYQRTYIAKTKDDTSRNVFIPESVYGLLAERIVNDVLKGESLDSVVQYSALKQMNFVMTLKDTLHRRKVIKEFFMHDARRFVIKYFVAFDNIKLDQDLLSGKCCTFMQHILRCDEDVVRLVYSQIFELEVLECAHTTNTRNCWLCVEKQNLLELALYYHHFAIADKLITMNASYTPVSLYNTLRHGDPGRVQYIFKILKEKRVFKPGGTLASDALRQVFRSGDQRLIEMFINEGFMMDSWHIVDAVQHGDMNVLMKVVEQLKCHKKWKPYDIDTTTYDLNNYQPDSPYLNALYQTYAKEKFDMADYLLNNEVNISMCIIAYVARACSKQTAERVILNLKDAGKWNPKCNDAIKALENSYTSFSKQDDVCDLLVQNGVSPIMKIFPSLTWRSCVSVPTVKKAIQHLKDSHNWDPKCDYASEALENAYACYEMRNDVCDLLLQEGVSPAMKILPKMTSQISVPLRAVKNAIQTLKDTQLWDPKCEDAFKALENMYTSYDKNNCAVCDLLVQEGVSPAMNILPKLTSRSSVSLQTVKKAIQHLKDTQNWDPKCDDASKALENPVTFDDKRNCDVFDLLVQEGVLLAMHILPKLTFNHLVSLKYLKKVIQHLKGTNNWDPKCHHACKALETSIRKDVHDLLVQEGVPEKKMCMIC